MILEYLETGRCDSLIGNNGAYNLYESELRQNLIILKLDEVIKRLDELNATMYKCCQAIKSVGEKIDAVHNELAKLSDSMENLNKTAQKQVELSALAVVYSAATAANTNAIKYLTFINQ